jgi:DNA-binding GntR family transcriptional regulator
MDVSSTKPFEGENQAQFAYRILEEMIVTLELPPGDRISEQSLSQRLGIGRTPVREAMQRLALEGTIKILPRAGAIISPIDIADQFKLIEVRRELERILTGRAARLADAETCRTFLQLAEDFEEAARANSGDLFIKADREFNNLISRSAQNNYAAYALSPIQAQTRRFWFLHFKRFGDLQKVSQLHASIARAVASNDEPSARAALDRLIDYVEDYTRLTLESFMQ